jgi:hypothetical protein
VCGGLGAVSVLSGAKKSLSHCGPMSDSSGLRLLQVRVLSWPLPPDHYIVAQAVSFTAAQQPAHVGIGMPSCITAGPSVLHDLDSFPTVHAGQLCPVQHVKQDGPVLLWCHFGNHTVQILCCRMFCRS